MTEVTFTSGGCQCGAVRYRLHVPLSNPHICHCRMCQKAFGSFFAPLAGLPRESFEITRGTMATFRSSDLAERGFCAACGTPLSFRYLASKRIAVSIGSLDDPEAVRPTYQYGTEARLSWFGDLPDLPGETTEAGDPKLAEDIKSTSHQHPDHDTENWP